jgi:hypothetical protein
VRCRVVIPRYQKHSTSDPIIRPSGVIIEAIPLMIGMMRCSKQPLEQNDQQHKTIRDNLHLRNKPDKDRSTQIKTNVSIQTWKQDDHQQKTVKDTSPLMTEAASDKDLYHNSTNANSDNKLRQQNIKRWTVCHPFHIPAVGDQPNEDIKNLYSKHPTLFLTL